VALPRLARALGALAVLGGALLPAVGRAELDAQVFTSAAHRLRVTVPKGWRASELPSYPGVLLWMLRSQPEARILLGSEPLTHDLFCSWPEACRTLAQPLASRYACAVRAELERHNMLLGPAQAGPKENVAIGLPSVWFEFTDGRNFARQALAADERRVVSLVLSTRSAADRGNHVRAFDQALRSLRQLSEDEVRPAASKPSAAGDAAAAEPGRAAPGAPSGAAPAPNGAAPALDGAAPALAAETAPTSVAMPPLDLSRPCP
jgi:hypothetical protein